MPVLPPQAVINGYKEIVNEAIGFFNRFIDSPIPLQESYPAPIVQFDEKRYVFQRLPLLLRAIVSLSV